MFNRYFQQELSSLRELAVEFSKAHPALAPMLEGPTTDPDVERLLEGVAFLTGLVREKIDDEFPEVIQGLMQMAFPHYLKPVPATTIIAFTPKPMRLIYLRLPLSSSFLGSAFFTDAQFLEQLVAGGVVLNYFLDLFLEGGDIAQGALEGLQRIPHSNELLEFGNLRHN